MNSLFTARHIRLFILGILGLGLGYILLGQGPADNPLSLSVAPVILVAVYLVVFPLAIALRNKPEQKQK